MNGSLYDLLLVTYPPTFREKHGAEMRRLFLERVRDARRRAGRLSLMWLWVRTIIDFAINAPAERLRASRALWSARGTPGGVTMRGQRGRGVGMDSFIKDVRYGIRTLVKNPTFTLIATVTIGLGIGANTAIFSVVRAVLLRPLPYDDPDELVMVWSELTARNVENFFLAPTTVRDMRESSTLLEDVAGVNAFQQPVNIENEPVQLDVGGVTPNFFSVLGVEPFIGRDFTEADAAPADTSAATVFTPGANPPTVTILSHGFWQTYYGGDPTVLGRTLDLGGASLEIVGVLPPDCEPLLPAAANVPPDVALWTVPRFNLVAWNPANVAFAGVARLNDGVTVEQAQAELSSFAQRLSEQIPIFATSGTEFVARPLHDDLTADVRPVVLTLLGAVGFLLLIACANVSNLLLIRAALREREMAVRAAIGASRARLVRQMLIETTLLAGLGAGLGLFLAQGGVAALLALQPDNLPRLDTVRIDGMVLGFTLFASLTAAVLFGLVPALQGSRMQLADSLKDHGKASSNARHEWLRSAVVVTEVALSVILLVGAGLMLRSFVRLQSVDPGFDPSDVLTFGAPLPGIRYPAAEDRALTMDRMRERLESLPGVEGVTAVFPPLLDGPAFNGRYGTERALEDESYFKQAAYRVVQPEFFETMRAELVDGRFLTRADNADSASVVVIDDKLAQMTWPGESAVGKRLLTRFFTNDPLWVDVVGVVKPLRHTTLAEESRETIYFVDRYVGSFTGATWMVRARDPLSLVDATRREVAAIDPTVPLADVRLLEDYVTDDMGPTRFSLTLIAVFGLTALLLASVGLYGILSSVVRRRTAEIGVRMAFGAQAGSILAMVVRQGLFLAVVGLGIGLLTAFWVTGLVESLLVDVAPADPVTFGATAVVFLVVATLSCYVPARRATLVDPVVALRDE